MTEENIVIDKTAQEIHEMYQKSASANSTNFLIYGGGGTAKTSLLRTCRTPVLVHSFDPGGCSVLEGQSPFYKDYDTCIDNGKILVDSRFEKEDPKNPRAFEEWDREYHRLKSQ